MTEAPVAAPAAADRPPIGLALGSLLRADLLVLLRSRASAVLSILLPIVIIVVTSLGTAEGRLGGPGVIIGLALTIGLITSCLLGYSLTLARDREIGVLQRLRVSPAPTWTIMTSRLTIQVGVNLIGSLVVIIVGSILHHLTLTPLQYALLLATAALGAGVFLALGQVLVALIRTTGAINATGRILYIILLLTGILGGSGILGATMQSIADWTPVGALLILFSDFLSGAAWSWQDANALLACAGYVVVFTFVGVRWFRWETH